MVFKYYLPVFVFYTRIIYSATGDSSADLRGVIVYFYKQTQAKFTEFFRLLLITILFLNVMMPKNDLNKFPFCDWIAQYFLPKLHSNLNANGYNDMFEFLNEFDNSAQNLSYFLAENCHLKLNTSIIDDLATDLRSNLKFCFKVESNFFYFEWILSFFKPLLYTLLTLFLLPSLVVFLLYASSLFLYISKHWNKLKNDYNSHDIWQASFKSISVFWETTGAIWHGHEIVGLENIPDNGPGLLVYYHAAMPIDYYYVHSKILLYKNRRMKVIADRFLFKVPGLASLLEAFEVTPGSLETCVNLLKDGSILSISPGGVREALFSDHYYDIIWGSRCGFAKVAHEAKAPIIPMFTENSREALRSLPFFRKFFRFLYEKTRLPLVPIYGIFPVKLRTYIGEPIPYDESRTPEELKQLTKERIEDLIKKHQRLPGSIFQAILDRFRSKHDKKE